MIKCIWKRCDNPNDKNYENPKNVFCLSYGEVDCRCHVQKQVDLGKSHEQVIEELIEKYFDTISNCITNYKNIIIVAIIPPMDKIYYESLHGPITHEFPFVGNNDSRVLYTKIANDLLEKKCKTNNYLFFNPYKYYTREDGCLKIELSDNCVHLSNTEYFIEQFNVLLKNNGITE